MDRLVPLDGAYKVEVAGNLTGHRTYHKQPDGTVHVPARDAKTLLREGLAFRASATGPVAHLPGYRCGRCGRRNYFRSCGACGSGDGQKE